MSVQSVDTPSHLVFFSLQFHVHLLCRLIDGAKAVNEHTWNNGVIQKKGENTQKRFCVLD